MAERGGERGGFGEGFSHGRGERGRADCGRGRRRGGRKEEEEKWVPVTKLGRLVKEGKIKSMEQIYLHSLAVKEYQIIDTLVGPALKDEVMKIMLVQKQTRAGQRTRFKAFVVVSDSKGHVGLGVKCSKEVATVIRGSITLLSEKKTAAIDFGTSAIEEHFLGTGGNSWSSGPAPPPPPGTKPHVNRHPKKSEDKGGKSGLNGAVIAAIVVGSLLVLAILNGLFARRSKSPSSHYLDDEKLNQ